MAMDFPKGLNKGAIATLYENEVSSSPGWEDEWASKLFGKSMQNPAEALSPDRVRAARSWIFLESFERFFGQFSDKKPELLAVLIEMMKVFEARSAEKQFLSPADHYRRIFNQAGREPENKIPPAPAAPRERFVWYLRWMMPGCYWWSGGRSEAFRSWLKGGAQEGFESYSTINCWEMIFFAAIKAGFLRPETLGPAYDASQADSVNVLADTFQAKMIAYDANKNLPKLAEGDVLVSDDFHHVCGVIRSDQDINRVKLMQLWGRAVACVTFYWDMQDYLDVCRSMGKPKFYVLKFDA